MDQATVPQQPTPTRHSQFALFMAVQVLILVAAIGFGFWFYNKLEQTSARNAQLLEQIKNQQQNQKQQPTPNEPQAMATTTIARGQIAWEKTPVEIGKMGLFKSEGSAWENANGLGREGNTIYSRIGKVTAGEFAAYDVIRTASRYEGMGSGDELTTLLYKDGKAYAPGYPEWFASWAVPEKLSRANIVFEELTPPETIVSPNNSRIILTNTLNNHFVVDVASLKGPTSTVAFVHPTWGTVYQLHKSIPNAGWFGGGGDGAFLVTLPGGTGVLYAYRPDILDSERNAAMVTWQTGAKDRGAYTYTDFGGCGSTNYIAEVAFAPGKELVQTGVAFNGEPVYELKDANHTILKDTYDNYVARVQANEEKAPSYAEFLKMHPVFFWKDPFGRMVKFSNIAYMPMTECGKPVIYLYPETTQRVDVQVDVKGGMSYSDPLYNDGWSVTATPRGELTNLVDGKQYPYLFWEGRGGIYAEPTKGWVVKKADVHTFLVNTLSAYGLNEKEIADFVEFWEPRMQAAPYYFVGFHGTRVMDALAPLTISPRPDAVFRILMDFKPLDAPRAVEAPAPIRPFERRGFTVVEWGGVIR